MVTVSAHVNAANIMADRQAQELSALRGVVKVLEKEPSSEGFANIDAMVSRLSEDAQDIAEITESAPTTR